MTKPMVSVVMGVYNEQERWLRKAIESILNQTYKNLEFIILLDNPKNLLLENIIKEYADKDARVVFEKNNTNIGLVQTLNKGIKMAKGHIVARMDADDISEPNRLEQQVHFLEKHSEVALIAANVSIIDEEDRITRDKIKIITEYKHIRELLKLRNFFYHPTFMFRKQAIEEIGLYREVKYAEDYDLICRLVAGGYSITNLTESLLKYRIRKNGITLANKKQQMKNSLMVRKWYLERLGTGKDTFAQYENKTLKCTKRDVIKFNTLNNLYRIAKRIILL